VAEIFVECEMSCVCVCFLSRCGCGSDIGWVQMDEGNDVMVTCLGKVELGKTWVSGGLQVKSILHG
jgi:hypothetical protein